MVKEITPENFESEVVNSDIPVLADFWAPWCGPCKMMAPVFDEVSAEFEGKVKFVKINTEDHPELASKYGITGIPCLIMLEKGEEKDRLVGLRQKDQLKADVEKLL